MVTKSVKLLGGLAEPKYPREKGERIELPLYGDAEHNLGIWCAIGVLVVNWGSDESVFLAILQALLGGDKETAIIVWLSFHNTANRLELVRRLTKQHVIDKALRADIESAVVEFVGCTKTRNFFCHAAYRSDDQARLRVAQSISLSDDGEPLIRDASRLLDRSTLNVVTETARRLADLNPVLWVLVRRLEDALQVPPAKWSIQRNQNSKDGPADP
ncbi:MAG TPA: hypothetical protein VGP28_04165 [Methylocella sp.]|nr:hypothetical protein [Methylocella sp.]